MNCTTIDWFVDWSKETLLDVASISLSDVNNLVTITNKPRVSFLNRY